MNKNVILSRERDFPALKFLWRWKVSTTSAIAMKFYPGVTLKTVYNRLLDIQQAGLIQSRYDATGWSVWMLTKKGFQVVREALPELREERFQSYCVGHDLLTNAVHLGDWFLKKPEGVELLTESELRAYDPQTYPRRIPKYDDHRPDGYWSLRKENECWANIALEVEITFKRLEDYSKAGGFYTAWGDYGDIHRVLWILGKPSWRKSIHENLCSYHQKPCPHNFVGVEDFRKVKSAAVSGPVSPVLWLI